MADVRINPKTSEKKISSKILLIILPVFMLLLAVVVFIGINVSIAKNQASDLKDDLEQVIECTKEKDIDGAEAALLKSYESKEKLNETLSGSFWTVASNISRVGKEISAGRELLSIVTEAQDNLLAPLIRFMKENPLSELKVGDSGFNVILINNYLDFLDEIMPRLEALIDQIMNVDTDSIMGSYVEKHKEKMYAYLEAYNDASALLPLLRTFLGNGEDRLYLLTAQNSAEIRASGGFPGSIGTIRIRDGVLTIGDFEGVYNVLVGYTTYQSEITQDELNIFGSWIHAPRDACFIPAFERAAQIWAVAYEDMQRLNGAIDRYEEEPWEDTKEYADRKNYDEYDYWRPEYVEYVDGVVSMTPAIIQMLLEDVGEITLSDGTMLDSTNATKVLQHDLYHKYFSNDTYSDESNSTSDALFAETAKTVMSEFVSSFEIRKFADYHKLFTEASQKNILMMWMKDEAEEEVMLETGVSGRLNFDPENPVCGVYFSLADPSKMGWYLDILTDVSEPIVNEDGSRSYDVTVTLQNTITDDVIENAHAYIIGNYNGGIRGFVHVFAPSGGYFEHIETESWSTYMFVSYYQDLEVAYNLDILIYPGESEVFHYRITTAEGVETPLRIITTPTLTEYR